MNNSVPSKEEKNRLNKMSIDAIVALDPAPILDALNIEYVACKNGTEYSFKSHSENTASSRFKLFNSGIWIYKNFANESMKGTVLNLIKDYFFSGNAEFHEVMEFCYDNHPEAVNYYQQAYGSTYNQNSTFDFEKRLKELEEIRELNKQKAEKYGSTSKVVKAYSIFSNNEKGQEFLKGRGFSQTPPFLLVVKGEWEMYNESTYEIVVKNQTGIGVLTGNVKEHIENIRNKVELSEEIGGDIHYFTAFVKKNGQIAKTQSFGTKTISYWHSDNNKNNDTILIFESKMDAAAAYNENPKIWTDYNVVIANGVGTASDVSTFINEHKYTKIINYNQNDGAAIDFISKIMESTKISHRDYQYITYKEGEDKLDINDLYKNGELQDRYEKEKGYRGYLMDSLLSIRKRIREEKRNVNYDKQPRLLEHDEKIIKTSKTTRDIKDYLYGAETRRYESLEENGFLKDVSKKQIFETSMGLEIESLNILFSIHTLEKTETEIIKHLRNTGVNMLNRKIENQNELREHLSKIDIKSDDEYEYLDEIAIYLEANKNNAETKAIMDEWVERCCRNNDKEVIAKANFLYFMEFSGAMDRAFKLINIGADLNISQTLVANKDIQSDALELTFDTNSFMVEESDIEEGGLIEDTSEDEILSNKAESNTPVSKLAEEAKSKDSETLITVVREEANEVVEIEVENNEPIITIVKEEPIKEVEIEVEVENIVDSLKEKNTLKQEFDAFSAISEKDYSLECELKDFEIVLTEIENQLIDVKTDLKGANPSELKFIGTMVREIASTSKTACNSICNRLKEEEVVTVIKNSPTKEINSALNKKRMEIYTKSLKNLSIIKEIEKNVEVGVTKNSEIKTTRMSSKQLVSELYQMCNKVHITSQLLKTSLSDLRKISEIAQSQEHEQDNIASVNR